MTISKIWHREKVFTIDYIKNPETKELDATCLENNIRVRGNSVLLIEEVMRKAIDLYYKANPKEESEVKEVNKRDK